MFGTGKDPHAGRTHSFSKTKFQQNQVSAKPRFSKTKFQQNGKEFQQNGSRQHDGASTTSLSLLHAAKHPPHSFNYLSYSSKKQDPYVVLDVCQSKNFAF
jgi:PBP1b-binding outer membrane lipoprotein LpoB